jgi:heme/copper-type cytochrome/quinol oxidase subunit 2
MLYIVVGVSILVIVVGAIVYAMVAMRGGNKPQTRITPFGEVTDDPRDP